MKTIVARLALTKDSFTEADKSHAPDHLSLKPPVLYTFKPESAHEGSKTIICQPKLHNVLLIQCSADVLTIFGDFYDQ